MNSGTQLTSSEDDYEKRHNESVKKANDDFIKYENSLNPPPINNVDLSVPKDPIESIQKDEVSNTVDVSTADNISNIQKAYGIASKTDKTLFKENQRLSKLALGTANGAVDALEVAYALETGDVFGVADGVIKSSLLMSEAILGKRNFIEGADKKLLQSSFYKKYVKPASDAAQIYHEATLFNPMGVYDKTYNTTKDLLSSKTREKYDIEAANRFVVKHHVGLQEASTALQILGTVGTLGSSLSGRGSEAIQVASETKIPKLQTEDYVLFEEKPPPKPPKPAKYKSSLQKATQRKQDLRNASLLVSTQKNTLKEEQKANKKK